MLNRFRKFILLAGDLFSLNLALYLTITIRYPQPLWADMWTQHSRYFFVVFIIWLLVLYINDFYNLNLKASGRAFFQKLIGAIVLSGGLSILYFYLNAGTSLAPKTNLLIFLGIFSFLFLAWRNLYQVLIHFFIPKDSLAIIGLNQKTEKIVAGLQNNPGAGYQAALIFKSPEEIAALADNVRAKNIHTIVICDDFELNDGLRQALFNCLSLNITFFDYPDFYELLTGKVSVEEIGPSWFLENLKEGGKNYYNFIKRLTDAILAIIILVITLPLWPLIAIVIKLESKGPVFFRQARLGRNEKPFKIIKFRTMRTESNDLSLTVEGDKRITRFGSFLRKTRLDEIPQVLNILRGEMSFIGPRPERPEIIADLEKQIPFYKTRLLIKPGLTGWDQISGHYHSSTAEDSLEKLQYELFYLKQRSLYLDLSIALRTIATMLSRGGR
ncbi:MAG: sugar transferase [bacterium]|nr:sugar transferase [bacterium]